MVRGTSSKRDSGVLAVPTQDGSSRRRLGSSVVCKRLKEKSRRRIRKHGYTKLTGQKWSSNPPTARFSLVPHLESGGGTHPDSVGASGEKNALTSV